MMTHEMMVADVVARVGRGEKPRRKWGVLTYEGTRLWCDLWMGGVFIGRVWNSRDGSLDRFTVSLGAFHTEVQIGGEPVVFSSITLAQVFLETLVAAPHEETEPIPDGVFPEDFLCVSITVRRLRELEHAERTLKAAQVTG